MSTWTSKVSLLAVGFALAACGAGLSVTRNAPMQVRLPDGLVVAGARGWCVDRTTSRTQNGASTIVLGSCAAIAGNVLLPHPQIDGVVTISVESASVGTPTLEGLTEFLTSERGLAVLARDGRADSVDLLEMAPRDGALFLHALDASGGPLNTGADYWRALFDIEGRFVSVSLIPVANGALSRDQSLATLDAQINRLKAANIN